MTRTVRRYPRETLLSASDKQHSPKRKAGGKKAYLLDRNKLRCSGCAEQLQFFSFEIFSILNRKSLSIIFPRA
jgi:hypothetical protein